MWTIFQLVPIFPHKKKKKKFNNTIPQELTYYSIYSSTSNESTIQTHLESKSFTPSERNKKGESKSFTLSKRNQLSSPNQMHVTKKNLEN